ncbi:MAG: tetratricopeptide repeat protein [candidate division Zixibacteria bacterium]|nr:tetratricopeptide repeat protein [candidate division Zixibacteria bacterium]
MAAKLTKHQMKEDKLVTSFFRIWEWSRVNTKILGIVAGSVAAVVLIVIYLINSQAKTSREAADLFGRASIEMQSRLPAEVRAAINDLQAVLDSYPDSRWADYSCFYLANLWYRQGDFAKAKYYFRIYLDQYAGDSMMEVSALGGLAQSLFQEKDYLTAADYFLKGADSAPKSLLAPQYLLEAGKAFAKAGMQDKAVSAYQRVIIEYPGQSYQDAARRELAQLVVS